MIHGSPSSKSSSQSKGSGSRDDAASFEPSGWSNLGIRGHSTSRARFDECPCVDISSVKPVHNLTWRYEKQLPISNRPKAHDKDVKDAQTSASMLKATLDAEFGCSKCILRNSKATCAAATSLRGVHLDMEWIADSRSARTCIAIRSGRLKSYTSPSAINMAPTSRCPG